MDIQEVPSDQKVLQERLLAAIDQSPLQAAFPVLCARARTALGDGSLPEPMIRLFIHHFQNPEEVLLWVLDSRKCYQNAPDLFQAYLEHWCEEAPVE